MLDSTPPCTSKEVERIFSGRITEKMLWGWERSSKFIPSHYRTKDDREYPIAEFEDEKSKGRIRYKKPTRLYDFNKLLTLRVFLRLKEAGLSSGRAFEIIRAYKRHFGNEQKIFQAKLIIIKKKQEVYVITNKEKATRLPDGQEILIDILLDEGIRKEISGEVRGKLELLRTNPKKGRFNKNVRKSLQRKSNLFSTS